VYKIEDLRVCVLPGAELARAFDGTYYCRSSVERPRLDGYKRPASDANVGCHVLHVAMHLTESHARHAFIPPQITPSVTQTPSYTTFITDTAIHTGRVTDLLQPLSDGDERRTGITVNWSQAAELGI